MKYKIYKLVYKGEVVYIGKTKTSLNRRKRAGYHWNEFLQSIRKECEMILIEETDDVSRERYWIDFYGIENLQNRIPGEGRTKEERDKYKKEYKAKWDELNREYKREQARKWWYNKKK